MTASTMARATLTLALLPSLGLPSLAQSTPMPGQPMPQQQQQQQQQQPAVSEAAHNDMQDAAPSSGVSGQMMKDKMFLRKAAEGGMAEVRLGQLASQKSSSADVKEFGARMVKDHTELNEEMKPIADSMGVMLPKKMGSKDQAEFEKLSKLSGSDFDAEYLAYMVKDHHADLREFHMEATSATDPTLKSAVEKGTQVIREHTGMVEALAKSKGVAVPARGSRHASPTAPSAP